MKKFTEWLILVIKGACIGIADAIPGVSGGTIAFILKIYDKLLDAIDLNLKKLKKNLPFLIPLGIGIVIGILLASKVLGYLFENHNVPTQFFFLGVIIGSLPAIVKECRSEGKLKLFHLIPFLIAAAGIILFNSLKEGSAAFGTNPVSLIVMMIFSAAAMIMPGLSGALVLKILGGYETAINAVNELDFLILAYYVVGAAIGLLAAAKIISILLKKCKTGTYCAIIGLIVGSLPAIYPKEFALNGEGIIAIVIFIIGAALPLVMEKMGKGTEKTESDDNQPTVE
ncbi:MAG: DUF368 domain-containing protein [Oscillospiraceae bacterium]|nr:DUF368 domain-containing protein [Oscillospiraceae bacterium]